MRILTTIALLMVASSINAKSARDYLPADADLDPAIPSPESVLGWEVGDWHVSHDRLVQYMRALADASDRISIKTIGYTHEQRPLLQLAISSPANQQNLDKLRQQHLDGKGPLVVMLAYSVHGNEPSGSNSSMLVAYYLAASRSAKVEELLSGSVILIDPSLNPDGLNRFASWANSNAGRNPVTDPITLQHAQSWPKARTNHYWFDLNRDWLPLVHPESRARIVEYHRWLPHVLTDHHEQTGYPGFFFQPGVPSRQNPLTPAENLELTRALAQFHSAAMDQAGQPHFTEDAYDDFYFGKGSTYPDINGTVGILFEQKAIRGQALETDNGVETFHMAIANQLMMSLSTLQGSWAMREQLKNYQAGFHASMQERAAQNKTRAWVVGDDGDAARAGAFLETLDLHRIEYQPLGETIRAGGKEFIPGHAWLIPARQKQAGLLEAIMEQRTQFQDNTFYDVSAWTLPLAYNLPFAALGKTPASTDTTGFSSGTAPASDARAWAVQWNQLDAAALLQDLLEAGARIRVATKPFSAQSDRGLQAFAEGTLVIQAGIQNPDVLQESIGILSDAALSGLAVYSLSSTMTAAGPDLGSKHFKLLRPINPLIVGGKGVSSYDAGEQWHLLDQRLNLPAPITEIHNFSDVELEKYSHLLLASGKYDALKNGQRARVARWVRAGGVLVAVGEATKWVEGICFDQASLECRAKESTNGSAEPVPARAYSDFADDKAKQVIGGAIVASVIDLSHPIGFGFPRPELPLFRRGTTELKPSLNAYSTPVRYTQSPLLAGFIGDERIEAIKGQPAVIAEKQGKGLVVRFANTPLFRGFWRGTERLFLNALYFGQAVEETEIPEFAAPPKPETPGL